MNLQQKLKFKKLAGLITENEYQAIGNFLRENKIPQSTFKGRNLRENKESLLDFIKQNKDEIANQTDYIRLEDINIDSYGDVGATGITLDYEDDEMESGLAFRYTKDVDNNFKGENGDKPIDIVINGQEISYIAYNM